MLLRTAIPVLRHAALIFLQNHNAHIDSAAGCARWLITSEIPARDGIALIKRQPRLIDTIRWKNVGALSREFQFYGRPITAAAPTRAHYRHALLDAGIFTWTAKSFRRMGFSDDAYCHFCYGYDARYYCHFLRDDAHDALAMMLPLLP